MIQDIHMVELNGDKYSLKGALVMRRSVCTCSPSVTAVLMWCPDLCSQSVAVSRLGLSLVCDQSILLSQVKSPGTPGIR